MSVKYKRPYEYYPHSLSILQQQFHIIESQIVSVSFESFAPVALVIFPSAHRADSPVQDRGGSGLCLTLMCTVLKTILLTELLSRFSVNDGKAFTLFDGPDKNKSRATMASSQCFGF